MSAKLLEIPSVPFLAEITGGAKIGTRLKIKGTAPNEAQLVWINLKGGSSDDGDIALHFRLGSDGPTKLLLNSLLKGAWGVEEIGGTVLNSGQLFEIDIVFQIDHFSIFVNEIHYKNYKYRTDLSQITHIQIKGATSLLYVGIALSSLTLRNESCNGN